MAFIKPIGLIPTILDLLRVETRERPIPQHIQAALDWLCRGQDKAGDGVSASYSLRHGWLPPYPETTGYIIPTFLACSADYPENGLRQRALRMADWELDVQLDDGAIPSGVYSSSRDEHGHSARRVSVFNTGQVLFGWCSAYRETMDTRYLDGAFRAGRWIVESQDEDGMWRRNISPIPKSSLRAYKARVAWALMELFQISQETVFREAAIRCLEWVMDHQQANGYFQHAGFNPHQDPTTHAIGYCIEGLLEGGDILGEERFIDGAERALGALRDRFERNGCLSATYNGNWEETASYQILTGNAQVSRSWLRLYQLRGDAGDLVSARKVNRGLMRTQLLRPSGSGIQGGIKATHPIWGSLRGNYSRFNYLNWATKFFIDTLLLQQKVDIQSN